jgi:hypothetical protein
VLVPLGLGVVVLALPAGALVVLGRWLGGPFLALLAALGVVAGGVLLARLPVSDNWVAGVQTAAAKQGVHLSRDEVRATSRRNRRALGIALVLAGGTGLAIAFAAIGI